MSFHARLCCVQMEQREDQRRSTSGTFRGSGLARDYLVVAIDELGATFLRKQKSRADRLLTQIALKGRPRRYSCSCFAVR